MTREQIKEHYADVVMSVFVAESKIKPTLQERMSAIGKDATPEQIEEVGHQYCLDIAEEILSGTSDEELEKIYGEGNEG